MLWQSFVRRWGEGTVVLVILLVTMLVVLERQIMGSNKLNGLKHRMNGFLGIKCDALRLGIVMHIAHPQRPKLCDAKQLQPLQGEKGGIREEG